MSSIATWFLSVRGQVDVYNMWAAALRRRRATDEQRRTGNALMPNARLAQCRPPLGAKATKAARPRTRCAAPIVDDACAHRHGGVADKVARIAPTPAAWTHTAGGQRSGQDVAGSLEVFTGVDLAIDHGSRWSYERCRQDHAVAIKAGRRRRSPAPEC